MQSPDERIALLACRELLDRHLGKPAQAVEVDDGRDQAMVHYNLLVRQQVLDNLNRIDDQGGDVTDLPTEDLAEIMRSHDEARKRGLGA